MTRRQATFFILAGPAVTLGRRAQRAMTTYMEPCCSDPSPIAYYILFIALLAAQRSHMHAMHAPAFSFIFLLFSMRLCRIVLQGRVRRDRVPPLFPAPASQAVSISPSIRKHRAWQRGLLPRARFSTPRDQDGVWHVFIFQCYYY